MRYANLSDREIGTMFLSSKEKDETLKKLRLEVEILQEERNDLANSGAGTVSQAFGLLAQHDHRADVQNSANSANDAAERSRLKAELKQAQDALNKACMENNKLREEARQVGPGEGEDIPPSHTMLTR
jgi:ABC-type phosphate transport system auxiliary subunit